MTILLICALMVPLWWSVSITMKAMKALKQEKKQAGNNIKGNSCCGKWSRRLSS
jgi:hypothetical protein